MLTAEFDFHLPPERIAQHPAPERSASRLLVIDRTNETFHHHSRFTDLERYLVPGDVLILNDSRVIPARLRARKAVTGGAIELLLLEENGPLDWWVMLRPGKRMRPGTQIVILNRNGEPTSLQAELVEKQEEGSGRLRFFGPVDFMEALESWGEVPLPPYMTRDNQGPTGEDRVRYQTVYARHDGSVAAPTAGLHFTPAFLQTLLARGIEHHFVTLHVGHGTFAPVKSSSTEDHRMHEERFVLSESTCNAVNRARAEGRRVVAVGTTSVRVLETVGRANQGRLVPGAGRTCIFIHPPQTIRMVDAMVTNFHLPKSTLLMLVSAFAAPGDHPAGRNLMLRAYQEAIDQHYRFFSYGDAMFLTGTPPSRS